jgi:hypothetical protein
MSQQLSVFMEKLTREVTEGMQAPRRVRLMCEGTVFETWEPIQGVGLDPEAWARDAETLVQALLPELPKRRVQLTFVAEDSAGASMGTLLRTVTGQNPSAQDLGTQNGAKALADAIASVAKTADAVLESARKMLDFQSSQLEKKDQQLAECHELFMAIKKVELEAGEQENAVSKIMTEQVQQALPLLMQLASHWVNSPPKATNAGTIASVVTNGAS